MPALRDFAVLLHRDQLDKHGPTSEYGMARWPVCRIDFTVANPDKKDLDRGILWFFGRSHTRNLPPEAAAECLHEHGTRLLVLAGLSGRGMSLSAKPQQRLTAHLIDLTTLAPTTIVLIGSDLEELICGDDPSTRQLASRATLLGQLDPSLRPVRARIRQPGDPLTPKELDVRQRLIADADADRSIDE